MTTELSKPQKEAITHQHSSIMVIGGAGTGKKTVLIERIKYLIEKEKVSPQDILVLCPDIMTDLALKAFAKPPLDSPIINCINTFRKMSLAILRDHHELLDEKTPYTVLKRKDKRKVIYSIMKKFSDELKGSSLQASDILTYIQTVKCGMANAHECELEDSRLVKIYAYYQKQLKKMRLLDIEDVYLAVLELFMKKPELIKIYAPRHLLVSSYEDTSALQREIIKLFVLNGASIFATCDPEQTHLFSINIDSSKFMNFGSDFHPAKIVNINTNYSSNKEIVSVINGLTQDVQLHLESHNPDDHDAPLFYYAYDEDDEIEFICEEIEILQQEQQIDLHEMAIMYRSPAQKEKIESVLGNHKIPYVDIIENNLLQLDENKLLISYLYLILNPNNDPVCLSILSQYSYGISPAGIQKLIDYSQRAKLSIYEACFEKAISLSTKDSSLLNDFFSMISELQAFRLASSTQFHELLNQIFNITGYKAMLNSENTSESLDEIGNIKHLIQCVKKNKFSLKDFIDENIICHFYTSLDKKGVQLIELVDAKYLSYKAVFICGFEEGLIPYYEHIADPNFLHLEKCLIYTGITRATQHVYLTAANHRVLFNNTWYNEISRFIIDMNKATALACFISDKLDSNDDVIEKFKKVHINYIPRKNGESTKKGESKKDFVVGDIIEHALLGKGIIVDIDASKDDKMLIISFEGIEKMFMERYAPIHKI